MHPVHHRGPGNGHLEKISPLGQRHEGQVAPVGPPEHPYPLQVEEGEPLGQFLEGLHLVRYLHGAHSVLDVRLEGHAPVVGASRVDADDAHAQFCEHVGSHVPATLKKYINEKNIYNWL